MMHVIVHMMVNIFTSHDHMTYHQLRESHMELRVAKRAEMWEMRKSIGTYLGGPSENEFTAIICFAPSCPPVPWINSQALWWANRTHQLQAGKSTYRSSGHSPLAMWPVACVSCIACTGAARDRCRLRYSRFEPSTNFRSVSLSYVTMHHP
jgi:hypothetical protein